MVSVAALALFMLPAACLHMLSPPELVLVPSIPTHPTGWRLVPGVSGICACTVELLCKVWSCG